MRGQPTQTNTTNLRGRVFDIKRFAIHDGPGIRTTVFLKGCPLRCTWCQNPEGIPSHSLLVFSPEKCIRCGECVRACTSGSISAHPDDASFIHIDRSILGHEEASVHACPTGALHWDSTEYSVEDLFLEVVRDRVFFSNSKGGVTLSGGEPFSQPGFITTFLERCRSAGIHTAIETTLFTSQKFIHAVLPYTDLFLADLKLWNSQAHKESTGVENDRILMNARFLAEVGANILFRIPLIPGITTNVNNIQSIAQFVRGLPGDYSIELLNFNPLAASKYEMLGLPYTFSTIRSSLSVEHVEELRQAVRDIGVPVV